MSFTEIIKSIFPHDGIYESIMGTRDRNKKYNLSPIGIIINDSDIKAKIYKNTSTFINISEYPFCSINIIRDPELFYYTLFNKKINYNIQYGLPKIGTNVLFGLCDTIENTTSYIIVKIKVFDYIIEPEITTAFSRGDSLFIDLLVHLTRLDILQGNELNELIKIISYEIKTIRRISPNLDSILNEIKSYIESKGFKLE
ncbi:DUF447 family protein [Acidianus sulfidivorans JP7]|uniref:DUF447 domain-containing protein n=1 Tax=Acidianus sulfidivorans JP7 TaxID=619593 RepID=A0A2U9IMM8_9CREN|nr:DUF447 domain-containing protein [Acidianus sulfidivorans]AWR97281.1 DUF447 family protein [Acidianus sulfidivorans JP7]